MINTEFQPNIVCPYCGYVDEASYETNFSHSESLIYQCESCYKKFDVYRMIDITYTTTKVEDRE